MKLLQIETPLPLQYCDLPGYHGKYKELLAPYRVVLYTDEGILQGDMSIGWVTDLRSGTNAINWFVPKKGNAKYNGIILFHDLSWSGWISRALSNELLCQGIILSGERVEHIANIVKVTVDHIGHYYELDDVLPAPYTNNRLLESLQWRT